MRDEEQPWEVAAETALKRKAGEKIFLYSSAQRDITPRKKTLKEKKGKYFTVWDRSASINSPAPISSERRS